MTPPVPPPHHLQSAADGRVADLMVQNLGIDEDRAQWLLGFGAVYLNRERLSADQPTAAGDWLRIHLEPRRFPVETVAWRNAVVEEADEFVVINKPAGIPVHATCDNGVENVAVQMSRALGYPLKIVHRLDVATSGLMVLGRSSAFQKHFQQALTRREVVKYYRALVASRLPEGEVIHYQAPLDRAPHQMSEEPMEGWRRCALEIKTCLPGGTTPFFEVTVQLFTGRHHQIRAQLSALGSPIVGDFLYGSQNKLAAGPINGEFIALQAYLLSFPTSNGARRFEVGRPEWNCRSGL